MPVTLPPPGVGREDLAPEAFGAVGQELIVGVPVQMEDSGANVHLEVLAYPPVIFLLEKADGDDTGAAALSISVLWRPSIHNKQPG